MTPMIPYSRRSVIGLGSSSPLWPVLARCRRAARSEANDRPRLEQTFKRRSLNVSDWSTAADGLAAALDLILALRARCAASELPPVIHIDLVTAMAGRIRSLDLLRWWVPKHAVLGRKNQAADVRMLDANKDHDPSGAAC